MSGLKKAPLGLAVGAAADVQFVGEVNEG